MKKTKFLKPFSELPPAANVFVEPGRIVPALSQASAKARTGEAGEDFRKRLRERASAPFTTGIPYHRWGLNE